ncbi:hypothetical protein Taro_034384 [Colocasia esculenta]|uniref:Sulfotransferase n=1 Tax=Colocasia esculenta TaxID=4460 RepID=A0A843W2T7_COLES|nr:hypothetical protein [Colocasia esculenta]
MDPLALIPLKTQQEDAEDERSYQVHSDLVSTLPEDSRWAPVRKFHGFWFRDGWLPSILATREHFLARPGDVFIAAVPKSGTTWLKSIVFSVVHRGRHPPHHEDHPVRHANPHDLVHLHDQLYRWRKNPDLTGLKGSYGIRPIPLDEALDMFCSGITNSGPFWRHVLEYGNEHVAHPDRVFFLKYEAMKEDPVGSLQKLAAFLGCPFTADEESQGVPAGISELCSFSNLRNLGVNKDGVLEKGRHVEKKLFFRKGKVGDWTNHLTPEMAEKLDRITKEKLSGSGLSF